jgi:hypothetical protein
MAVDEAAVKTETFADTGSGTMATAATEKGPMSVATKAAIAIVAIVASAAVIIVLYIVTRDAPAQSSVVRMKSQFAMDVVVPSEPTLAPSVATSLAPSASTLESAKTSLVPGIESPKKRSVSSTDVEGPTMIPPAAAPTSRPSTDTPSEGVAVPTTEQVPPTAKPATGPTRTNRSQFDHTTGTTNLTLNSSSAASARDGLRGPNSVLISLEAKGGVRGFPMGALPSVAMSVPTEASGSAGSAGSVLISLAPRPRKRE